MTRNIIYVGTYSNQLVSNAKFQVAGENEENALNLLETLLLRKFTRQGLTKGDIIFKDVKNTGKTYPDENIFFYQYQ